ncbi:MAG: Hsp20/alpha crystallin family protein [Candidatus Parcubacteria bacterium]|nr:Hsp20/alpha crystallin family protein [Candidatus Parcubacteria bacterium]
MIEKKRSFFERLTGSMRMDEEPEEPKKIVIGVKNGGGNGNGKNNKPNQNWIEEENEEAELTVDVYQTAREIIVQTMVAGVKPEDLELTITRDMLTIRGERAESRVISDDDFFTKELYWGKFSRTISLPAEVEPEEVEAVEKHGLLTIKLQKVDKEKRNNVKVKSI